MCNKHETQEKKHVLDLVLLYESYILVMKVGGWSHCIRYIVERHGGLSCMINISYRITYIWSKINIKITICVKPTYTGEVPGKY